MRATALSTCTSLTESKAKKKDVDADAVDGVKAHAERDGEPARVFAGGMASQPNLISRGDARAASKQSARTARGSRVVGLDVRGRGEHIPGASHLVVDALHHELRQGLAQEFENEAAREELETKRRVFQELFFRKVSGL